MQVPRAVQAVQVEQVEQAAQVPRAVQAVQVAQVPRAAGGAGAEGGAGGAGAEGGRRRRCRGRCRWRRCRGRCRWRRGAGGQAADPCVDIIEDADPRLTNDFGVLFTEGGLFGIEWGPQGAAMAYLNVTLQGTGRRDVAINVVAPADDLTEMP